MDRFVEFVDDRLFPTGFCLCIAACWSLNGFLVGCGASVDLIFGASNIDLLSGAFGWSFHGLRDVWSFYGYQ